MWTTFRDPGPIAAEALFSQVPFRHVLMSICNADDCGDHPPNSPLDQKFSGLREGRAGGPDIVHEQNEAPPKGLIRTRPHAHSGLARESLAAVHVRLSR